MRDTYRTPTYRNVRDASPSKTPSGNVTSALSLSQLCCSWVAETSRERDEQSGGKHVSHETLVTSVDALLQGIDSPFFSRNAQAVLYGVDGIRSSAWQVLQVSFSTTVTTTRQGSESCSKGQASNRSALTGDLCMSCALLHDFQCTRILKNPVRQESQGVVVEVQLCDGRETLERPRRKPGEAAVPDVATFRRRHGAQKGGAETIS